MSDLAAAICTKDNTRTIGRTLDSLIGLAQRIVVVDSGSIDGTVELCRDRGAEVVHREWTGYASQKQFAIDQCREHRWVILLDSDESIEPELRSSIEHVLEEDDPVYDGWELNRKVWFLGGWLHHAYQPEWRLRLVRGGTGRVTGADPHDRIEVPGAIGRLNGDLRHDSWADIADLAARQLHYARESARHSDGGSVINILLNPPAAFFKQLILKRAILDGRRGIIVAGMSANFTLLKHAMAVAERLRQGGRTQE